MRLSTEERGIEHGDRSVAVQRALQTSAQKNHLGKLSYAFKNTAVHYERFLAQGFPIGSGEVESAHRYIPQKRLKIPGATWHPYTVNPMLALRIIRANGWWEDFWTKQSASH